MLAELRVRNLALITQANLELGPGLTVLSGETGAGKTALLSSLKLLIGERGDASLVGLEADETRVEALFITEPEAGADRAQPEAADEPARTEAADAPAEPGRQPRPASLAEPSQPANACEHLAIRRVNAEGRSRCYLDDSLVTVAKLSEVIGPWVDLYGQHEHQSLLRADEQLRILDDFLGEPLALALDGYRAALLAYDEASGQLQKLLDLSNSSNSQREQAAFIKREIEKLAPEPGEYEALEQSLPRLQHAEQLAQSANQILESLRGDAGVLERLAQAEKSLATLAGIDADLGEPLEQLSSHLVGLEELGADLGRYAASIEFDDEAYQRTLDRLGALDGLSRRFGPGINQVFAQLEEAKQLLASSEDSAERIQAARQVCEQKEQGLRAAAAALSQLRAAGLQDFIAKLNESIKALALAGASLESVCVDLPFEKWTPAGPQTLELLYRPAPDAAAKPLAKIASGGELSRVMLAIKGLLQSNQRSMTLVFDEIDAGIGGKTALAVAQRLAQLAQIHQVIVITHLAQIAVLADSHYLVDRSSKDGQTLTTITHLDAEQRVGEIARMLSGSADTEALAHAQKMLEDSQVSKGSLQ